MKTTKPNYRLLRSFLILFAVATGMVACNEIEDRIEEYFEEQYSPTADGCKDGLLAKEIPNQFIIEYNPEYQEFKREGFYTDLLNDFKADSFSVRPCDCDEDLELLQFYISDENDDLDMEGKKAKAVSRLQTNDDNFGDVFFNIPVEINPDFEKKPQTRYDNKPGDVSDNQLIIAVMDGGINPDYFSESTIEIHSYNFLAYKEGSVASLEINPHGTIVARIIADGLTDIGNYTLMDLRIFDKNGNGNLFDAICATSYAIQNDADIINMSWGYHSDQLHHLFLKYLRTTSKSSENIVVVASAGNDSINTDKCSHYPSGFNEDIGVGSLGNVLGVASVMKDQNVLEAYSNYGEATVGIAAREGEISIEEFKVHQGTSYAAPMATIVAAKHRILFNRDNDDIVKCIMNNVDPVAGLPVISEGILVLEPKCE